MAAPARKPLPIVLALAGVLAFAGAQLLATGCKKKQQEAAVTIAPKPTATPLRNGLVFFQMGGQVQSLDPESKTVKKVTEGEGSASDPAVSPDGGRIAYWLTRGTMRSLFVMNSDGTNAVEVASMQLSRLHPFETDARMCNRPAWSPDGKRLAYCLGGPLYVSNADGTNPITVLSGFYYFAPSFSPKGDEIALACNRGESDTNLWLCTAPPPAKAAAAPAGGAGAAPATAALAVVVTQLTIYTRQSVGSPCWAADGRGIFCTRFDDRTSEVLWLSHDGKELKPLTEVEDDAGKAAAHAQSACPSLSADGKLLIFTRKEKERWTIWQMKPDGSNMIEMLSMAATSPSWAPAL